MNRRVLFPIHYAGKPPHRSAFYRRGWVFNAEIAGERLRFAIHAPANRPENSIYYNTLTEISTGMRLGTMDTVTRDREGAIQAGQLWLAHMIERHGEAKILELVHRYRAEACA
jgi:hypothetical protein